MNAQPAQEERKPELVEDLRTLGAELTASEIPAPNEVRPFLGAIVRYLQTGSLEAPERPEPAIGTLPSDPRDSRIAELEAQLHDRELAEAGPSVTEPSPVAPPPISPAETSEPAPPIESVPPASPADSAGSEGSK